MTNSTRTGAGAEFGVEDARALAYHPDPMTPEESTERRLILILDKIKMEASKGFTDMNGIVVLQNTRE